MDNFRTTSADMQRCASRIAEVGQNVNGQLSALQGQLEPLAGAWKGQAATSFHQLMERWNGDVRKLNQALDSISQAMCGSAKKYDATDTDQKSTMTGILGAMGA